MVRRTVFAGLLVSAFLLLSPSAIAGWNSVWTAPSSGNTRIEIPDATYLTGALAWSSGRGGLDWGTTPASDDSVVVAAAPSSVEFTSLPLPKPIHLNATKLVQLDIYVKATDVCSRKGPFDNDLMARIQLWAGGTLLAGSVYGQGQWWPYASQPTDPTGWATCRYRMPTEISFLAKGTVLRLRITPNAGSPERQLGLAGDHASVLRLPFFSPQDVVFRGLENEGSGGAPAGPGSGGSRSASQALPTVGGGLAGLGGIVASVRRLGPDARRRSMAGIVVLSFLLVALSGCGAHGPAARPEGGPDILDHLNMQLRSAGDSGIALPGFGAVVGSVHDDLQTPVPSAHLSLIGSNNFTTSDGRGQFALSNVPPGKYTLSVTADGYRGVQAPVEAVADTVTHVDVPLVPLGSRDPNERPHFHDYWSGPTHVAFDGDLGTATCDAAGVQCGPQTVIAVPRHAPGDESDNANSILPGTYGVDITVTWDRAKIGIDRMLLAFQDNSDPTGSNNWSALYPRESGAPFHIVTTWEMDDPGHQVFTTWNFRLLRAPQDADNSTSEENTLGTPGTAPQFHVRVVLTRGLIPLEPAHPEPWGNAQKVRITRQRADGMTFVSALVSDAFFGFLISCYSVLVGADQVFWGQPQHTVPPGTRWLEVRVNQDRPTGIGSVGHFDWILQFKPATSSPSYYSFPYKYKDILGDAALSSPNPGYRPAAAPHINEAMTEYSWKIPLDPEWADGTYSKRSAWDFAMYPNDYNQACTDAHESGTQGDLRLQLTVYAHRDVMT